MTLNAMAISDILDSKLAAFQVDKFKHTKIKYQAHKI